MTKSSELRRVDSFKEISFNGDRFKIISPFIKPHDLVSVESTEQGVLLYCAGGHVALQFVRISLTDILEKKIDPRIFRDDTRRTDCSCRRSGTGCLGEAGLVPREVHS